MTQMRHCKMYINVVTVFVIFKIGQCWTLPFEGLYRLDIIHYNDFHARFEETSVDTPTCRYNNNSCLGGFPRLYHEIDVLRKHKPDAIILNAGDSFQGTYWYSLLKWNITQEFMNMIPHDAHAVGNHEFDDGPAGLAPYIRHLNAPVLAANIDVSQEPTLQSLFENSTVVKRKGRQIGIIGVTTVTTKNLSNPGKVVFTDPGEALQLEAEKMVNRGVDIIILLSHCGLDVDKFEETSVDTPTCRYNNNSCLGGFPRLYHEIDVLRKHKPDAIILNAGDSFQGTYWYSLLKWNITQEFMNMIPHDAHAVGNHEFDDGPAGLAPYIRHLNAPVLAANIDVSQEPTLQSLFENSTVVKRKGRQIGIIGVTTVTTKNLSNPGKVVFTDPGEALQLEAEKMVNRGVDIIILLSHCGLDVDKQLAKDYGQYIDVIIGGHTHSLLWNSSPSPSGEDIAGPYPVFIQSSADEKHKVLIVQASAFTKYMGNLSVNFDVRGDYVSWEGGPIFLDRTISEDKNIKAKLAPYAVRVHEAENVSIGVSLTTLRFEDCVFGECTLGDMLCDSLNEFGKEKVKSNLDYLSFMQRGNIKASIMAGDITHGTLFELLPYNDRVESFELQGTYVLEALERSVRDAWAYDPFKGPWVLQFSGLQVTLDVSKPEGQRVVSAMVGDKSTNKPLDKDAYYQVTAPAFLADGGDGYTMFRTGKRNMQVIGRDQATVEAYLQKHSPLNVTADGRMTIIQRN